MLTPVALPVGISLFSTPVFVERYAIIATPALYLLAAKGVEVTSEICSRIFSPGGAPKAWKAGIVWLSVATVLIVLFVGELQGYFSELQKEQWREAIQYMNTHAQSDDLVLLYPEWDQPVFDYYNGGTEIEQKSLPYTDVTQEPVRSILSEIKNRDRVWAIEDQRSYPDELFPDWFFEGSHTLVYHHSYSGIEVACTRRDRHKISR